MEEDVRRDCASHFSLICVHGTGLAKIHPPLPAAVEETANEKSRAYPSHCVSYPCSWARPDQVLALTASGTVGYATCRRYNAQRGELEKARFRFNY